MGSNKLAFKSKVVSRAHAEIWVENGGRFFIKDTKSSSGTFLNHVRLSPANTESLPKELKDGDLLQLGVDYQGGTEDIYKCVKIKVEVNREWQAHSNPFKTFANLEEDVEVEIEDIEGVAGDVSAMIESLGVDQAHESTPPQQQTPVVNVIPTSSSGQQPLPPIPQSTPPGPQQLSRPPSAGNERGSHSRERHHHDPGAETEVEPDSGGLGRFRSGAGNGTFRARGVVPPLPLPSGVNGGAFMGVDVIEDVDQEMEDLASPLPQHFALPGVAATAVGGGIGVVVERDEDIVEDVVGGEGQEGSEDDEDGRIEEASHGSKRKR
ncbi:hypothetical protein NLI96_g9299 [Meripilus lineatus]|uniref:FHA domain-containing protein n=1 Tax=Meripilus lineatus TaxID=2056292 RepID=A0AAD5UVQ2_9APHY|nr:hypothetical protein NLI96_g9299 [Physisporinus lineatus]